MNKEFIIKQWLKDSGFEYSDHYGLSTHSLNLWGEAVGDDVAIQLEGTPALGTVSRAPADDEVIMVIRRYPEEGGLNGEAWVVISLADPDCFYHMDGIIREGLVYPAKWNFKSFNPEH